MAGLNDHGEDLRDLVLVVSTQIPKKIRVEREQLNFMSANHSGNKSELIQFDLVLLSGFLELGE